jgi:hypothetical protein
MSELLEAFNATTSDTVHPEQFAVFIQQAKAIKGCM